MALSLATHKLMIPGPVEAYDDVLAVMSEQVTAHYGPEWVAMYNETVELAKQAFFTDGLVIPMVSSGTGALEAAIASMFAPGERVLIGHNGFFGQRAENIVRARGLEPVLVRTSWGQAIRPEDVRRQLREEPNVAGVIVVHHETSTGVLNPLEEIAEVVNEFDLPFIVDAVASFAGEPLRVDAWGIDMVASATNKCLGAPPGLALLAIHPRAWGRMEAKPGRVPGWYLDVATWRKYMVEWGEWHPTPVTMSSGMLWALYVALTKLIDEGMENRWAHYKRISQMFRDGVAELGYQMFIEGEEASSVISAVNARPGQDPAHLIKYLAQEHNIQIAGGLGDSRGKIFRVGHMGKAASEEYVNMFLDALRAYD